MKCQNVNNSFTPICHMDPHMSVCTHITNTHFFSHLHIHTYITENWKFSCNWTRNRNTILHAHIPNSMKTRTQITNLSPTPPQSISKKRKAENICSTSQIVSEQIVLLQFSMRQGSSLFFHLVHIVPIRHLRYLSGRLHAYTSTWTSPALRGCGATAYH